MCPLWREYFASPCTGSQIKRESAVWHEVMAVGGGDAARKKPSSKFQKKKKTEEGNIQPFFFFANERKFCENEKKKTDFASGATYSLLSYFIRTPKQLETILFSNFLFLLQPFPRWIRTNMYVYILSYLRIKICTRSCSRCYTFNFAAFFLGPFSSSNCETHFV